MSSRYSWTSDIRIFNLSLVYKRGKHWRGEAYYVCDCILSLVVVEHSHLTKHIRILCITFASLGVLIFALKLIGAVFSPLHASNRTYSTGLSVLFLGWIATLLLGLAPFSLTYRWFYNQLAYNIDGLTTIITIVLLVLIGLVEISM